MSVNPVVQKCRKIVVNSNAFVADILEVVVIYSNNRKYFKETREHTWMLVNFNPKYSSPISIHYEAPQIGCVTQKGSGVEILVQGNEKLLVIHTEEGEPRILGRLLRCEFNSGRDTDGKRRYYYS